MLSLWNLLLSKNEQSNFTITKNVYCTGNNKSKPDDTRTDDLTMLDANATADNFVPALGKFWQSICSTRLLITRSDSNDLSSARISGESSGATDISDLSLRIIRIIKCNQLKTGNQCMVNISDIGIR